MFRRRLYHALKTAYKTQRGSIVALTRRITPVSLSLLATAYCDEAKNEEYFPWTDESLGHEFLIRQATTVNVNAATQLLTVTLVAIQDTSERLLFKYFLGYIIMYLLRRGFPHDVFPAQNTINFYSWLNSNAVI